MKYWPVFFLLAASCAHAADNVSPQDAMSWLKKMAGAARQLNYTGTFVYQHGNQVETSRIAHFVNAAGGEFEKLETLDGPAREIVRTNDQVTFYLPKTKTVVIEERANRQFPILLPERLAAITENYQAKLEEQDRVAGFDCMWIALVPKDNLRYGRRFCAEMNSGLPLRARIINEKKEPVESFAFTQLSVGVSFSREKVKSRYAENARAQNWRIERSAMASGDAPVKRPGC